MGVSGCPRSCILKIYYTNFFSSIVVNVGLVPLCLHVILPKRWSLSEVQGIPKVLEASLSLMPSSVITLRAFFKLSLVHNPVLCRPGGGSPLGLCGRTPPLLAGFSSLWANYPYRTELAIDNLSPSRHTLSSPARSSLPSPTI